MTADRLWRWRPYKSVTADISLIPGCEPQLDLNGQGSVGDPLDTLDRIITDLTEARTTLAALLVPHDPDTTGDDIPDRGRPPRGLAPPRRGSSVAGALRPIRTGRLVRTDPDPLDPHGTPVAWIAEFPDGHAATRWLASTTRQTSVWDSVDDVIAVHGHNGATYILWDGP